MRPIPVSWKKRRIGTAAGIAQSPLDPPTTVTASASAAGEAVESRPHDGEVVSDRRRRATVDAMAARLRCRRGRVDAAARSTDDACRTGQRAEEDVSVTIAVLTGIARIPRMSSSKYLLRVKTPRSCSSA